jgi:hypothetical protein
VRQADIFISDDYLLGQTGTAERSASALITGADPPICVFRGGDRLTAVAIQIGLICIRQDAWRTWLRAIGGWHSAFITIFNCGSY